MAFFIPWVLFFSTLGQRYLSPELYAKLDISAIPVRSYLGV